MPSRAFGGAFLAAAMIACAAAAPAHAADIYKPAYEPPPDYGYTPPAKGPATGWYIGGLVGYGLTDTDFSRGAAGYSFDPDGAIGGGLVGWNYINNRFVIGLEGDLLASGMESSQVFAPNTVNGSVGWVAGLRARAGVHVTPEIMLFGALGGGWADIDLPVAGPGGGGSQVFSGIQYGGGAEVALSQDWSLRLDYLYTDLDSDTIAYPGGAAVAYDPDVHQLRAGLQLHF